VECLEAVYTQGMDTRDLRNTLLSLPPEERADLARELLHSLDEKLDPDRDVAWASELARRAADVKTSTGISVPWTEARDRILQRLRVRRG
jgi:putative addiction module component (TIGR02574 family)